MKEKDPSREPEMEYHYISHGLLISRLQFEGSNPEKVKKAKEKLIFQLTNLYDDDSQYFNLAKKCVRLLEENKWESPKDFDEFHRKYKKLRLEIID